ncbi:MAG: hypothetical protein JWO91_579 [Acidobacteriaceae bacterium]|nr:hypothetical protein [Acidobacteriaceae bacterium]
MLAGKRCSPTLVVIAIAIILSALVFLGLSHSPNQAPPKAAPIHQADDPSD